MRSILLILIATLTLPAMAQEVTPDTKKIEGLWKAALVVRPDVTLRLMFHFSADGKATMDSVDQGAKGMKLDGVTLDKTTVTFALAAARISYKGTLSDDGKTIAGFFTQGAKFPLTLTRTDKAETLKRPQTPKGPFPYRIEDVGFSHSPTGKLADSLEAKASEDKNKVSLAATLTLPQGAGPFPAAVLVSGSGAQDRDESILGHKPFAVIADHLTRQGIAVLRYDDRGTAKSTGDFSAATTADLARDARAAVRYLRTRKDIAADRVGIIGHSEGGLIAPMVATTEKDLGFIVLLAGPGVPGQDIILHQTALIMRAGGAAEADIQKEQKTALELYAVLNNDRLDDVAKRAMLKAKYLAYWNSLTDAQRQGATFEQFVANRLGAMMSPWFRYFIRADPRPSLAKVSCPTLALFASLDLQVDPAQNAGPIAKALAEGVCKDYAVITLPQLNHLFQRAKTGAIGEYGKIEHTIDASALRSLSEWLVPRVTR